MSNSWGQSFRTVKPIEPFISKNYYKIIQMHISGKRDLFIHCKKVREIKRKKMTNTFSELNSFIPSLQNKLEKYHKESIDEILAYNSSPENEDNIFRNKQQYTLSQVNELLIDSSFNEIVKFSSPPLCTRNTSKKDFISWNSIEIKSEGETIELAQNDLIYFDKMDAKFIGNLRKIKEIQIEIARGVILDVYFITEVYITQKEFQENCANCIIKSLSERVKLPDVFLFEVIRLDQLEKFMTEISVLDIRTYKTKITKALLVDTWEERERMLGQDKPVFCCSKVYCVNTREFAEKGKPKMEIEDLHSLIDRDPRSEFELREIYDKACEKMELACVPDRMLGREKECNEIRELFKTAVMQGGLQKVLHISGMPGTGKTATVIHISKELKALSKEGILPSFHFLQINAMLIQDINQIYLMIYEKLTGLPIKSNQAFKALDSIFTRKTKETKKLSKPDKVFVLFLDEFDQLLSKKQELIFNLFDWPTHPHSNLFIITVSNSIVLPETFASGMRSQIEYNRIIFHPYTREQMEAILTNRLKGIDLVDDCAIRFISAKIALTNGDLRNCLKVVKKSIQNARSEFLIFPKKLVGVSLKGINKAYLESFGSIRLEALNSLSCGEFEMLASFFILQERAPSPKLKEPEAFEIFLGLCEELGEPKPCKTGMSFLVNKLINFGLIAKSKPKRTKKNDSCISLIIDKGEFKIALKGQPQFEKLLMYYKKKVKSSKVMKKRSSKIL